MTDVERHQLISDLLMLSKALTSAIQTAQGDQLQQLLVLSHESAAAVRELQQAGQRSSATLMNAVAEAPIAN